VSTLAHRAVALALSLLLGSGVHAEYAEQLLEVSRAWGMVVADFNGDGHDDLYVTGHDPNDRVWYWSPTGYVPSPFVFSISDRHDCDAADVDGDGLLDLYCAVGALEGRGKGYNELWLQGAEGVFVPAEDFGADDPYGRGRIPVFLDFNHDGWPDIYLTNQASPRVADHQLNINHLYLNQQDGRFVEVQTGASGVRGHSCAVRGDIDGDGWDDLVVCNDRKPSHVYLNDRAGDFVEVATPALASWRDARLADVDGDGRVDLVVVTATNRVQAWLNTGAAPYFQTAELNELQPAPPRSLAIGDFDRNGRSDIYVVQARADCLELLHDLAPDLVYWGRLTGTWERQKLPQDNAGCGHQAETVDGDKVLLTNGGFNYEGPSYLLTWLP
jgi:hypothetical protein